MTFAELVNKVGFKVNDKDVKNVNDAISDIKSTAVKLLGAIGIGFSIINMNALVEEFDAINDKINYAVSGLGDAKEAQKDILAAANAVKTSYSDMASVVTNLVKANSDMFPIDQAISFSTNLTKLMKSAGRNDSEIASIMEGMNKSFQKGIVDTETLNKMLEQAPETANYLAERLGVAKTQLLQMATDGTISVNDLKDAFIESSDEIEAAFGSLNFSVSDALLNIRNKWGFWLKETDEMMGMTQTIGKIMVKSFDMGMSALNRFRNAVLWLTDKLGGTQNAMKLLGIVSGVILGGKALSGLVGFIKCFQGLDKAVLAAKMKMLSIVAVIVLIALLIEDFINFMQGNDSVIGSLFEKAGIDCDKLRKDIIQIWENVKTVLSAIWQGIKNVAIPIFQGIWNAIKAAFEAIGGVIEKIAPKFADFISELANGKVDTAKWAEVGEIIAKIAVAIVGVVVAVKTVNAVVKTAIGVVKGVSAAISFLTSPIGLAITAIVALIAIGVLLWKNWDKIKAFAISIWTSIKDFIAGALTGIKDFFVGIWESIIGFLIGIWDTIKLLFTTGPAAVRSLWEAAWNGIKSFFSGILDWIENKTGLSMDGVRAVFGNALTVVKTIFSTAFENIKAVVSGAFEIIKTIVQTVMSVIQSIISVITAAIHGDWAGVWEGIKNIASSVWEGIKTVISVAIETVHTIISNVLSGILTIFQSIWDTVVSVVSSAWDNLTTILTNIANFAIGIFDSLLAAITTTVGNIKDSIIDGFQAAIDWITGLPAQAVQWGSDIIQGIVDGITGAIGKVGEAVSSVADKIKSFLGFSEPEDGPLSDFHTYMPDMIQLMAKGIQKGKSVVSNAIKDLTGGMSNEIQDIDPDNGGPEPKNPKGGWNPKFTPSSAGAGSGGLETVKGVIGAVSGDIQTLVGAVKEKANGSGAFKDAMNFIGNGMNALVGAVNPKPSTVSTVTGSNNVSRSVVQNIEINNKYEGDRAGQQKSSQAAKEAGKDITTELARGLSYAR